MMTNPLPIPTRLPSVMISLMILLSSSLFADTAKVQDFPVGHYYVDATLISYKPGEEVDTYSYYGSGGFGPNATLGLSAAANGRNFEVRAVAELKAKKCLVVVKVVPASSDSKTKAQEINFDLSDLTPHSVEIARDGDGRIYKLNLIPRMNLFPKAKEFKAEDFELESLNFKSSPVILNDQDYVGELGMTGGSLAWCEMPGVARIEFSLLHLKDALPIGVLSDGILTITHESGTSVRISNVTNGINDEVLRGGPYKVWVRWNKPSLTKEQYRLLLQQQIAMLQAKTKSGDLTLPPGTMDRLAKMAASDRLGFVTNGVRGVRADEIAN